MDIYLDRPLNLKGPTFICNDLCNFAVNYIDTIGLQLSNVNNRLLIGYNDVSSIKFNNDSKFNIFQITVLAPSIHIIEDHRYPMELIISHKFGDLYKHLCILIDTSDKTIHRQTLAWQLFDKMSNQLPQNTTFQSIGIKWNAKDLLPLSQDRSFVTFNMDSKNNFIVFNKPIYLPTQFYHNFIKNIISQDKYDQLSQIPIPTGAPSNIILFAKKNINNNSSEPESSVLTTLPK